MIEQTNYIPIHFFLAPNLKLRANKNTTVAIPTLNFHARANFLLRAAPCAVPKQERDLFRAFFVTSA